MSNLINLDELEGTIDTKDLLIACAVYAKAVSLDIPLSLINEKNINGTFSILGKRFQVNFNEIKRVIGILEKITL
jgi:hypothetical protein